MKGFVERLQERANREVERELRSAILRLSDLLTDVVIERTLAAYGSPEREQLDQEVEHIGGHIYGLRFAIAHGRKDGEFFLGEDTERALRLAKEGRRGRAQRARRSRASEASTSTVTPAPAPMRALPASTRAKRGKAPPAASGEPIYVGGSQLFLLGPGEKR